MDGGDPQALAFSAVLLAVTTTVSVGMLVPLTVVVTAFGVCMARRGAIIGRIFRAVWLWAAVTVAQAAILASAYICWRHG